MEKILKHTVLLNCGPSKTYEMFTNSNKISKWLCTEAFIENREGGSFELYWNPEDKENDSTIGCKITAMEKDKLLCFDWKGPTQYKHFMNNCDPLGHVTVSFIPVNEGGFTKTEVFLIHTGWRNTPDWTEAREWFSKAWEMSFERLQELLN